MFRGQMFLRSTLISLFCLASLTISAAAAPLRQSQTNATERGISVVGYGDASAPADTVLVKLSVGDAPNYGPTGPEFKPVNPEDLADMVEALTEVGIEASTIVTKSFGFNPNFGPTGFVGEVRFTSDKPLEFDQLLRDLKDKVEDLRGPNYQLASATFMLKDCETLETESMKAALEHARTRATRLADIAGLKLGEVIAINETASSVPNPYGGVATAGLSGCAAFEHAANSFTNPPVGLGTNSPAEVEVPITINVTFALE